MPAYILYHITFDLFVLGHTPLCSWKFKPATYITVYANSRLPRNSEKNDSWNHKEMLPVSASNDRIYCSKITLI